ncbi:Hint domain-containing protein [Acetobacter malorum]|uniref:Hint domain-containing protein n=1 Tax=Acetobacter malorum TaxID=178901 RepID=UPI00248D5336|nr:Hint domain-containing protein [Acetobacter malorum]
MASTTTWTGAVNNLWTDSGNWTNGVPTYSTTPIINASDSISINLNGTQNTNSIETTGNGTVTFTNGNLELNGNLTMASGQSVVMDGSTLTGQTITTSSGTGTITVTNGATLQFDEIDVTLNFGPASSNYTNTVNFTDGGKNIPTITNLSPGDNIVFPNKGWNNGINFKEIGTDSSGNTIYEINDGYNSATPLVASVTLAPGVVPSDFTWDANQHAIVCFLGGSMIRTSQGDKPVEDVKIGDEVVAFDWKNNKDIVRPVVWVGKARAVVRPELHDDEAGWPVRILKDAIADGVPYKDMLITAEHCLFFKDRFVPVRMLVNSVSIFYDKSITSYDYYHVETEQHSVITADGMLTESYLDTGNRSSFRQAGKIATLRGAVKSWEDDAGAPLGVARSFVEPLFRSLEWRENSVIGCQTSGQAMELTNEPDLHLVTDTGSIVRPMRKTAHQYSFMLPPNTQSVRIVTRASRPSDVIGPFVDDRRYMGVAVADVRLQCAKQHFDITSHLQEEKPEGWHETDWTDCAWTNGNAELPLGDHLSHGKMGILSMTVRAAGPYLLSDQAVSDVQKRSA